MIGINSYTFFFYQGSKCNVCKEVSLLLHDPMIKQTITQNSRMLFFFFVVLELRHPKSKNKQAWHFWTSRNSMCHTSVSVVCWRSCATLGMRVIKQILCPLIKGNVILKFFIIFSHNWQLSKDFSDGHVCIFHPIQSY